MVYYYGFINLLLFVLMGVDKGKAKKHQWRIAEKKLFAVSLLGGGIGGLLGILVFSHKKRKWRFPLIYTASIFLHIAIVIFLPILISQSNLLP